MPKAIYENLTRLKQHLGIQPINTGKQLNYRGIISDDMEALHAIKSMNGDCVNLVSGVEFAMTKSIIYIISLQHCYTKQL